MHPAYKLYALLCVAQAPLGLLLVHELGPPGTWSLTAAYLGACFLAAMFVPFYLTVEETESAAVWAAALAWAHVLCAHWVVTHDLLLWALRFSSLASLCACGRLGPLPTTCMHAALYLLCVVLGGQRPPLLVQAALDALLVLAHTWDAEREVVVEQNAHLLYLCLSNVLLSVALFVPHSV